LLRQACEPKVDIVANASCLLVDLFQVAVLSSGGNLIIEIKHLLEHITSDTDFIDLGLLY
jgi:hypothetical protein